MDSGLDRLRRDICLEQQWWQQSTLAHLHVVFPLQVCWVPVTHPGIPLTYAVKSQILLLTYSRLESWRVNSHWVNQAADSHKVDQRREERNQVRQSREQRWDQEKPRMKHEDFRQAEGGLDQNHYTCDMIMTCDTINVIFIYSETFLSKELSVPWKGWRW